MRWCGQRLANLLNGEPARLASAVADGAWRAGLYPDDDPVQAAAGLVWMCLGSPSAEERWRAAHSIRCFAHLDKWEVLDAVMAMIHREDAHPFQAPELPFYFLHARLWLLIAMARVAMDYPHRIAAYKSILMPLALGTGMPHVLIRHFAADALLACVDGGVLQLTASELEQLGRTNQSAWPIHEAAVSRRDTFYEGRPNGTPEPSLEFHLDYEFGKSDVEAVSDCFNRPHWQTKDAIGAWVHKWAPTVTSMYELGGRDRVGSARMDYMNERYQTYGQQLGWHGLMVVAGDYLTTYPVFRRPYDTEDPWKGWLRRELLTRSDGLWLADGTDETPLEVQENLSERDGGPLKITGDRAKLLSLVGLTDGGDSIQHELVVGGDWRSYDDIVVHLTSALSPAGHAKQLALKITNEDGFTASLPIARHEDEDVRLDPDQKPCVPWTMWPERDVHLDGTDTLGATSAAARIRLTSQVIDLCHLTPADPFGREWKRADGAVWARSEAWATGPHYSSREPSTGYRLVCQKELLREVLANSGSELVLLLVLRRYEEGHADKESRFWHATAAIRVRGDLSMDFYQGLINQPQK